MTHRAPVIVRMQSHIQDWETASDDKALFLKCYLRMTSNVLAAIEEQEFEDPVWVGRLLERFAGYYFTALEAYERDPASAPVVWQQAHHVACASENTTLQKLLLGINAHINYDLVLTLADLLRPEWPRLSERQREARYADHCHVNDVIGRTIDEVQDQVLEPAMPLMDFFDKLLGPIDELLISLLITRWRETVWMNATCLLAIADPQERAQFIREVEEETFRRAVLICRSAASTS